MIDSHARSVILNAARGGIAKTEDPYVFSLSLQAGRVPPSNLWAVSQVLEFPLAQAPEMGGSGKAEGFADGGWANHRQAALAAATRRAEISRTWDVLNSFDGARSVGHHPPKAHGQTSLPVPPGVTFSRLNVYEGLDDGSSTFIRTIVKLRLAMPPEHLCRATKNSVGSCINEYSSGSSTPR